MKIGINTRYMKSDSAGIAIYLTHLMINLLEIDCENEYFLFSPKQENYLSLSEIIRDDSKKKKAREVISWPLVLKADSFIGQISKIFWEKIFISYEIKRYQIDVFHDPAFSLPLFYYGPKIITIHDLSFRRFPNLLTTRTNIYYKLFLKNAITRADLIIAVSDSVKRDIVEYYGINDEKIRVVYEGINELYLRQKDHKNDQIVINNLVNNKPYILSVSAMNPRKNIPNIIRAFAKICNKYRDLSLVLVGRKAWLCEEIEKTIEDLKIRDKIIFTGYVDDNMLKRLYQNALLFLYPSLYEGFGLPLLEAMACGVPIITSNISSMPEIAGNAGILVNPFNYQEIAEAIDGVLSNEATRNDLICKGRERVKKFSWRKAAEQTLAIYKSLA